MVVVLKTIPYIIDLFNNYCIFLTVIIACDTATDLIDSKPSKLTTASSTAGTIKSLTRLCIIFLYPTAPKTRAVLAAHYFSYES